MSCSWSRCVAIQVGGSLGSFNIRVMVKKKRTHHRHNIQKRKSAYIIIIMWSSNRLEENRPCGIEKSPHRYTHTMGRKILLCTLSFQQYDGESRTVIRSSYLHDEIQHVKKRYRTGFLRAHIHIQKKRPFQNRLATVCSS